MAEWMDELSKARWLDECMNYSTKDGQMDELIVYMKMFGWIYELSKPRWLDGWMICPKQDGWMNCPKQDGWMNG